MVCAPSLVISTETVAVAIARLGSETQQIVAGSVGRLVSVEFGPPLHSLVLAGSPIHFLEADMLRHHAHDLDDLNRVLPASSWPTPHSPATRLVDQTRPPSITNTRS